MIFTADELDKRKKSSKVLLDTCTVVEFAPLKDAEAKAWAKSRLKELKVTADDQVLSEIISLVGTDVQTLSTSSRNSLPPPQPQVGSRSISSMS
jgi:DNA polymerase III delta subunit